MSVASHLTKRLVDLLEEHRIVVWYEDPDLARRLLAADGAEDGPSHLEMARRPPSLSHQALAGRYELAILDKAPGLVLSVAAMVATDSAAVPMTPDALALGALRGTLAAAEKLKARLNPRLAVVGLVLSMIDTRTALHREVAEDLRARFTDPVLAATVRQTVKSKMPPAPVCP